MDDLPTQEPIKVYENTYIMAPFEYQRFKKSAAEKILKQVLEEKLEFTNERDKKGRLTFTYTSDEASEVIRDITDECQKKIVAMAKEQNGGADPRFKFVFQASMGENHSQMIRNASRCLWDSETDNCASATWTNGRVYAVAMCYALYYE